MSYELDLRPEYSWAYQQAWQQRAGLSGRGLGAASTVEGFAPECVAWVDENYDFRGFDAKRMTVEAYINSAPVWPGATPGLAVKPYATFSGRALPAELAASLGWSRVKSRGRALVRRKGAQRQEDLDPAFARFDHYWTEYLRAAALYVNNAAVFLRDLAKLVNLPVYWLFPTDPNIWASPLDAGERAYNVGAYDAVHGMVNLIRDPSGIVGGSSTRALANPDPNYNARMPIDLLTGKYLMRGFEPSGYPNPRTYDNPHRGAFGSNYFDLADFWKLFQYRNKPQGSGRGQDQLGYPPGFAMDRNGPPAARYGSRRFNVMGPVLAVHTTTQLLRLACSRSSLLVVGNAFESYGAWLGMLVANAPEAREMGRAGEIVIASFKVAGKTLTGAGVVSGNPYVAAAGVVVQLGAEVADALPNAVGKIHSGYKGPSAPLLVRPPAGCAPGTALALEEKRREAEKPSIWDKLLARLREWGPYVGVGALGLGAAYLAYRALRRKPNRRRRGSYYFYARGFVAGRAGLQLGESELALTPAEQQAFMDGYLAGEQALTALTPTVIASRR